MMLNETEREDCSGAVMRVGIPVICVVCGRQKAPHGRSIPDLMWITMCHAESGCSGYRDSPEPGCLWPGESEKDFGFHICNNGVKDVPNDTDMKEEESWEKLARAVITVMKPMSPEERGKVIGRIYNCYCDECYQKLLPNGTCDCWCDWVEGVDE